MRRSLIALALCAAAAGCASRIPVAGADRLAPVEPPLEARLSPPWRGVVSFWTSRPAHIAIFELIPGQGVSLVYPVFEGQERRPKGGTHWAVLSSIPGRWFYFSRMPAAARYPQPRYLYLIASERPLRLGYIQRNPNMLRRFMSLRAYTVFNARLATDAIDRLVVPNVDGDHWVSDLYVHWPEFLVPRSPPARWAFLPQVATVPAYVVRDSAAPPDSTTSPGDTASGPDRPEDEEKGVRPRGKDGKGKVESDDPKAEGPRRQAQSLAELEDIDVPWSPSSRAERTARADGERGPARGTARSDHNDSPWSRDADGLRRAGTASDRGWQETRGSEAVSNRGAREAGQAPPARGESARHESRGEPRRHEPQRAEPAHSEPSRAQPRAEPRTETRQAPARQEPREGRPPGSSH